MKNFEELEKSYRPTKREIDSMILEKFLEVHHAELNGLTVTNLHHSIMRFGIESLQDLYEIDLDQIAKGRTIGEKKLRAIENLKKVIHKELTEAEP